MQFLIQFKIDSQWHTIARRTGLKAAVRKAVAERRGMKDAHPVSIISEGSSECCRRTSTGDFINE